MSVAETRKHWFKHADTFAYSFAKSPLIQASALGVQVSVVQMNEEFHKEVRNQISEGLHAQFAGSEGRLHDFTCF